MLLKQVIAYDTGSYSAAQAGLELTVAQVGPTQANSSAASMSDHGWFKLVIL